MIGKTSIYLGEILLKEMANGEEKIETKLQTVAVIGEEIAM